MSAPTLVPAALARWYAGRADLLGELAARESALADHQQGISPMEVDAVRVAALDALATAAALADAATHWSWVVQVMALEHGASLDEVAAASGQTFDEVLAARLTAPEAAELLAQARRLASAGGAR